MNSIFNGFPPLGAITIKVDRRIDGTIIHPDVILCGAPQYAAIRAAVAFEGRDRRRIKREINKAMKKAQRHV